MAKQLNIYLPPAPAPNIGKYEIFRDGERTGELITNSGIRAILTREQYSQFLHGDDIFYVQADKFRTRTHKKKTKKTKGNG